jgi:hypothetical protein
MHTFAVDMLMGEPEEEPILTTIERTSTDNRRIFREVFPLDPPSPVKRARRETAGLPNTVVLIDVEQDRYNLNLHNEYDDPPLPEVLAVPKVTRAVKPSVRWWIVFDLDKN